MTIDDTNLDPRFVAALHKYGQLFLGGRSWGKTFETGLAQLLKGLDGIRQGASVTEATTPVDFHRALDDFSIPKSGWSLEDVIEKIIVAHLGKIPNPSSGLAVSNVLPAATVPAILAKFATALINPNIVIESYGGKANEAEKEAISQVSKTLGYDPKTAGGYFTSGGAFSNYWSLRYALEKAYPGFARAGFSLMEGTSPVIFESQLGHYSNNNAARLLGVGTDNVVSVPVDENFSMDVEVFELLYEAAIKAGKKVVYVYLLAGSTDAFGVDNIRGINEVCDRVSSKYGVEKPYLHVDAAVGWIYTVFLDYDIAENALGFSEESLNSIHRIKEQYGVLNLADSITVDPHKYGMTPYSSSALILKNREDLALLQKDFAEIPYFVEDVYHFFPGSYTPESSRGADAALMSMANFYALGTEGYQCLVGYCLYQVNAIKIRLKERMGSRIKILNDHISASSVVLRFYPEGQDADSSYNEEFFDLDAASRVMEINQYNNLLFEKRRDFLEHNFVIGYSDRVTVGRSGSPISAWKCVIFYPFIDVDELVDEVVACCVAPANA